MPRMMKSMWTPSSTIQIGERNPRLMHPVRTLPRYYSSPPLLTKKKKAAIKTSLQLPRESNGIHRSSLESEVEVKIFMILAASKLSP